VHAAAYRELGVAWDYTAIEVRSGELGAFLASLEPSWRGLSLTMPLKREILPFLDEHDSVTARVGAANTVLLTEGVMRGFNTDVGGVEQVLAEAFPGAIDRALILGSGATAASVALALAHRGARQLVVATRTPGASAPLATLAAELGMTVEEVGLDADPGHPDVVVSTLPGTAELAKDALSRVRGSVPLVDIAYDPWPTRVARLWLDAGGEVANHGLRMLVYQALLQVRIFFVGSPDVPLPGEAKVLDAMTRAASAAS
jgi:shikimate dehydrogenase